MPLTGDSIEYEILKNACTHVKGNIILTCEIGVHEGMGSKIILDAFKNKKDTFHWHIGIDPYGHLKYQHYDDAPIVKKEGTLIDGVPQKVGAKLPLSFRTDYTNEMKAKMLQTLNYPNFTLYQLEDTEFFKRFADGVPVYHNIKQIMTQYDLVYFDGPHSTKDVLNEVQFFIQRASKHCVLVFDDYPRYNLSLIWDMLKNYYNFEVVERGANKIVFQQHA